EPLHRRGLRLADRLRLHAPQRPALGRAGRGAGPPHRLCAGEAEGLHHRRLRGRPGRALRRRGRGGDGRCHRPLASPGAGQSAEDHPGL
ncbi:MAG: hypothetical protein AVDCRST_MAG27-185, partial [uncultured Craurococcus sp.]